MAKRFLKILLALAIVFAMCGTAVSAAAATSGGAVPCVTGFNNTSGAQGVRWVSASRGLRLVAADYSSLRLYPGGVPFGVKFLTEGVIVIGFTDVKAASGKCCPATDAGLRQNDVILKINDDNVTDAQSLSALTEKCGGKSLTVTYSRDGKVAKTTLRPAYCKEEGKYKTGMFVRDSGAGIGTVT